MRRDHEDGTRRGVVLEPAGGRLVSPRHTTAAEARLVPKGRRRRTGTTQQTVRLFSAVPLTFSTESYTVGTQPSSEADEAIDMVG